MGYDKSLRWNYKISELLVLKEKSRNDGTQGIFETVLEWR